MLRFPETVLTLKNMLQLLTGKGTFLNLPNSKSPVLRCLEARIAAGQTVGLVYLDIVNFHEVQQSQGTVVAARALALIEKTLQDRAESFLPGADIVSVCNIWADDYLVLITLDRQPISDKLLELSLDLRQALQENVGRELLRLTGREQKMHVGFSLIEPEGDLQPGIKLYIALREAQKLAKSGTDLQSIKLSREFRHLLNVKSFTTVYQPIISLRTGETLGWEALTRGPEQSSFCDPVAVFRAAEESGLLYQTERICREAAIRTFDGNGSDQRLFLNVHPLTMSDPYFVEGETMEVINKYGLPPQNIVFEVTEKHSIVDYPAFKRTLEHYRRQGYRVAIDDVGAGYSGLQSIAELRPDFIKIDMSLVRDIDGNLAKRAVVEAMVTLAAKINCSVIAEGIETKAELDKLIEIGVQYGQGFFLAKPGYPKPSIDKKTIAAISRKSGRKDLKSGWQPLSIGAIAVPVMVVEEQITVEKAKEELATTNQPLSGLVVVRGERPVGLVMRHNLYRLLGSQYGVALYSRKPVSAIMDCGFLQVIENGTVEHAAELAASRESEKLYDDLVVVAEDGSLVGVVPVNRLLETVNRQQIELAKGANPLTGFPGNLSIEEELSARARQGQASAIIYADLDRFKAYNDSYGFEAGDKMLVILAKAIAHAVYKYGTKPDFIGHIGGDDFIIVTDPERAEKVSASVVRLFDRLRSKCYSVKDWQKGTFTGWDRQGQPGEIPLVSVSLAVVDCWDEFDYQSMGARAAQMKKYAKSIPGSGYVRDRRLINGAVRPE